MKTTARLLEQSGGVLNPPSTTIRVHVDGGANRSITNTKDYLLSFCNIKKYPMSGVVAGKAALICTGVGYLPWQSNSGVAVLVKCYFSQDAANTIISFTDIVVNNITDYNAWSQYSNVDTGDGYTPINIPLKIYEWTVVPFQCPWGYWLPILVYSTPEWTCATPANKSCRICPGSSLSSSRCR